MLHEKQTIEDSNDAIDETDSIMMGMTDVIEKPKST